MKIVDKEIVRSIKFADFDKTYRATVIFKTPIKDLKLLKQFNNTLIAQETPTRVLRRRSDKIRKRRIKNITYRILGEKKLELKIKAQSGLYIKELINGDNGRTKPSISEILNNEVKKIELDVMKIHSNR